LKAVAEIAISITVGRAGSAYNSLIEFETSLRANAVAVVGGTIKMGVALESQT
jgi:hypothetical protein